MQSLTCSSSLCVHRPSGTARLPGNAQCFQGDKLLITIWMARGLGIGLISAPELTVPQVVLPKRFLGSPCVLRGGRARGMRPESRTWSRWQGGGRSRAPRRLILCSPSLLACPAAVVLQRASPCSGALSLVLLGFRRLSLEQSSLPWAPLHFAGLGHCRLSSQKNSPGHCDILTFLQQL